MFSWEGFVILFKLLKGLFWPAIIPACIIGLVFGIIIFVLQSKEYKKCQQKLFFAEWITTA